MAVFSLTRFAAGTSMIARPEFQTALVWLMSPINYKTISLNEINVTESI